MSDDRGVSAGGVYNENAVLADGGDSAEFSGQTLIEFGLAGAIVAAACFAMSAMMSIPGPSQAAFEPIGARVQLPFAPALALRSAVRDAAVDSDIATASIPPPPAAAPVNRTLRPKAKAAAVAPNRTRSIQPRKTAKARENPLQLIGNAASAFASDFARDFGRLPGQISALFSGESDNDATRPRKTR